MTENLPEIASLIKRGHYATFPEVADEKVGCLWVARFPGGQEMTGYYGPVAAKEGAHKVAQELCDQMDVFLTRLMAKASIPGEEPEQHELPLNESKPVIREPTAPAPLAEKPPSGRKPMGRPKGWRKDNPIPYAKKGEITPIQALAIAKETPEAKPEPQAEPEPPAVPEVIPAYHPGDHVITYGRHTGKRLREVTKAAVEWYAEHFAPANPSDADKALIEESKKFLVLLAGEPAPE